MTRTNRLAILTALLLVVAVAGTVLATRAPQAGDPPAQLADETDGPPDAEAVTRVLTRFEELGIEADEAEFSELAGRYGLGGAVRLYAWADEKEMSVEEIAGMRDGDGETPVGWGRLARELGVHPGIGSIMGNGRGQGEPPGQERDSGD